MSTVKILICYHKKAPLFKDDILTPIHVGRANARERMDHDSEEYKWLTENMIGDDTGENISYENDSYNEMTALYWAWKNYDELGDPDYIGLNHYRRHFVLNGTDKIVYNIQDFNKDTYLDQIGYSEEKMHQFVEGCDFVTHLGHVINVYNHYIENQRKTDIDLANQIVLEQHPEYKEVMDEYYAGDDSNFCNMNIFSKKIFFEYCEWIFPILDEFKKRVDVDEKRFFISERLTGIYIAKLMKDSQLIYKTVPISLIDEPVKVTTVMKLDQETMVDVATAVISIMQNSSGHHFYQFYFFVESTIEENLKDELLKIASRFEKCSMEFIDTNLPDDYLPLFISDLLPSVNKCLYLSGKVLSILDIGEFFHVCSVDDYFLVGIPEKTYDPAQEIKTVTENMLLVNCNRMREHQIAKEAMAYIENDKNGQEALNELCEGQIGYIAWYYYTSARLQLHTTSIFPQDNNRARIQHEVLWRPFLILDYNSPLEDNQNVYSIFWWEIYRKLPLFFQKTEVHLSALDTLYKQQQIEINSYNRSTPQPIFDEHKIQEAFKEEVSNPDTPVEEETLSKTQADESKTSEAPIEDWRSYGFWGKLRFYYKHNGFKQTVKFLKDKVVNALKG